MLNSNSITSYSVLIIDDEPKACQLIHSLIDEFCEEISDVKICCSPIEGIELINKHNPDLVFLDVRMPEKDGFSLMDSLKNFEGKIILTTAYSEHALKAFQYGVFDYLLKPISVKQITNTVNRAIKQIGIERAAQLIQQKEKTEPSKISGQIAIHDKGGMVFIPVDEIFYVESIGNYSKIHCSNKYYISSKTIKLFEENLAGHNFIRVHRSFIVNLSKIDRYLSDDGGSLLLKNNVLVPVSRRKRKSLFTFSVK